MKSSMNLPVWAGVSARAAPHVSGMFVIRCDRARGDAGVTLWLKTTSPTETWGPRLRAMEFALTDSFVVGLGCDLVGAWLLARGLIASAPAIVLRGTTFYGNSDSESFSAAEDRVDAWFGVGVLILGYALQAVEVRAQGWRVKDLRGLIAPGAQPSPAEVADDGVEARIGHRHPSRRD